MLNFVGVGPWPKAMPEDYFNDLHGGRVPPGILNTVVPAAPDIWLTALERFGTMSFAQVSRAAIRFARDGFPMYPFMREVLDAYRNDYKDEPSTTDIFMPGGKPPVVGELFYQRDLAATLSYLAEEETNAARNGDRAAGFRAARRAFYEGDIAAAIVEQQENLGGFMRRDDLASFRAEIEKPVRVSFRGHDLYGCGPWSQGPMVLAAAKLLEHSSIDETDHSSGAHIHTLTESLKLAAADREAYFGDPAHIDVPLDHLLSHDYLERRAELISRTASPGMPAPGIVPGVEPEPWQPDPSGSAPIGSMDGVETSYFCVIDRDGNLFSATPSDPTVGGAVVPGTGITTCMWGTRAYTGKSHPSRVGPGRRPRMAANPMLVIKPGELVMPIGSPGSEVLGQAQLQVLVNQLVFGMDPQSAVEAPRFASASWPASAIPHRYEPGRLNLEATIDPHVGDELAARGHDVNWWPERNWRAGSVCTIRADQKTGVMTAGADPRRSAYAIGW